LTDLSQIIEEVGRCKEILKNLLDLGRIEEMDVEPLDLRVPVERALRSLEAQARIKGALLESAPMPRALRARGDLSLLQEALAALLQNAVEAVDENGRIRVEVRTVAGRHRVAVSDDGAGVPAERLERVFQPFFTTKPQGSGLGLSAALRIAEKHGGTIELESDGADRGSRFTFILPEA
jgi:signal transduction histidine kinase